MSYEWSILPALHTAGNFFHYLFIDNPARANHLEIQNVLAAIPGLGTKED